MEFQLHAIGKGRENISVKAREDEEQPLKSANDSKSFCPLLLSWRVGKGANHLQT